MKITIQPSLIIFVLLLAMMGASHTVAQEAEVKILRIEIDGKPIKSEFNLYVNKDGRRFQPVRNGRSFRVPTDLGVEPVSVEVLVKGLHLWFEPVYPSKFMTNWIIGVDRKPFDGENLGTDNSADVRVIYYIQFVSSQGDDTRLVITEKKKVAVRRHSDIRPSVVVSKPRRSSADHDEGFSTGSLQSFRLCRWKNTLPTGRVSAFRMHLLRFDHPSL